MMRAMPAIEDPVATPILAPRESSPLSPDEGDGGVKEMAEKGEEGAGVGVEELVVVEEDEGFCRGKELLEMKGGGATVLVEME